MKKLQLDIDALVVTSFEADATGRPEGTVAGHEMISGESLTCRLCPSKVSCPTIVNTCCTPVI